MLMCLTYSCWPLLQELGADVGIFQNLVAQVLVFYGEIDSNEDGTLRLLAAIPAECSFCYKQAESSTTCSIRHQQRHQNESLWALQKPHSQRLHHDGSATGAVTKNQ